MGPGVATAKIANFYASRKFSDHSQQIDKEKESEMGRWTAPEKLIKAAYSVECEVFSFGMLLWELSFQQVPYYAKFGNDHERISRHVILDQKREYLNFDYKNSNDIQQCFKKIISSAWKHKPSERLKLQDILTKLNTLYNEYYITSLIKHGVEKTSTFEEEDCDDDGGHNTCGDDNEESSTGTKNSMPLEQGIIFHKEETSESRKKAWQCFVYHADVLESPLAKYWKAYYLLKGYAGVDINLEEAKKLFKDAADNDIGDAQFFYAKSIKPNASKDSSIAKECVGYFEMAAENGVSYAMYYLGNIFYDGKYNVKKDQDRAISYFKEAAKNGVKEAKDKLENMNA